MPGDTRIVLVSSAAHDLLTSKELRRKWDPSDEAADKYNADTLYGRSKMGNLHTMHALADQLEGKGVVVMGLHPGNIRSDLQRHLPAIQKSVIFLLTYPVALGATSQLYAGTVDMDDAKAWSRAYLVPWAQRGYMAAEASDKALVQKTWTWCEEQTKGF